MARVDVIMPQMGESIAEGTVSQWLKQVGDSVKRDEAILEISTDKVDAEIPAPASGILAEIKVEEGTTVEVQTVVAVIETDADAPVSVPSVGPEAPSDPVAPPAPSTPDAPAPTLQPAVVQAPAPPAAVDGGDETTEDRLRRRSTPLVRRIAAEHDVDISAIAGTGYAGRVTKKDILGFLENRPTAQAPAAALRPAGPSEVAHPLVEAWPGDVVEPMSRIRKLTADHMIISRRTSAHVVSFFEIDYTHVANLRRAHKKNYEARGAKLTYLTFILKVVADNLRTHKVVNASVSGDNVIYRQQINLGIAVALDWGLLVPVLKGADELSMVGLAKRVVDLADRARTKKLNPDEVQNGTFTITNPGVFGSYVGAPIINQPQVAILGVGSIEKRPKVLTLDDGQDVIAIRTMGMLSLAYDHRIVDGANADRFMSDVKAALETFPEGAL